MPNSVSFLTSVTFLITCSFSLSAATLTKTGAFFIDETTSSGSGAGASQFYMPGKSLVDVSLTVDATLTYDYVQYLTSPRIIGQIPPTIYYGYSETLTVDDPFGNLFEPKKISVSDFGTCSESHSIISLTFNYSCGFSGSESFSSVPVNITGEIPNDFVGLDIINFSFVSSFDAYNGTVNPPELTYGSEIREFEWSGTYTLTYTYVPVPAAVWLFGSGLIGLIGIARHKHSV
jgi:hypothetical protein